MNFLYVDTLKRLNRLYTLNGKSVFSQITVLEKQRLIPVKP